MDDVRHRIGVGLMSGARAGVSSGVVAAWTMATFERAWVVAAHRGQDGGDRAIEDDRATAVLAQAVATVVIHRPLASRELHIVVPAIRYSFGAMVGAAYGACAEMTAPRWTDGVVLGALLWLVGDELIVPALESANDRRRRSPAVRAQALASHIVYGIVLHAVWRAIRAGV